MIPLPAAFLAEAGSWILVVLGVGLLVFIHEAGHFLAAKWAGVKVLAFSLGFGPEMVGFTRGPTRYRIAWVPLGGYVKMSGETELPEGGYAPDDFPAKPVWKRGVIMIAGVVMNALLGFVLFAAAYLAGVDVIPAVVGSVRHGGGAWEAGVRPGDRVVAADGHPVRSFEDLMYATMGGAPVELDLQRGGTAVRVRATPSKEEGAPAPAIGVLPPFGRILEVVPGGAGEKAGFRTGDEVVAVAGVPAGPGDLRDDEVLASAALPESGPLLLTVLREGREIVLPLEPTGTHPLVGIASHRSVIDFVRAGGPGERAGFRPGDVPEAVGGLPVGGSSSFRGAAFRAPPGSGVRVRRGEAAADLPLPDAPAERLELLRDLRFADPESPTAVEVLPPRPPSPGAEPVPGPAAAAGMRTGDRITTVAGTAVTRFRDVRERIAASEGGPVEVAWVGPSGKGKAILAPAPVPTWDFAEAGLLTVIPQERFDAGGAGNLPALGLERCVQTTRQILATVRGIFSGSVDKSNLGGPVAIAQITKRSTESGTGRFLEMLAKLSINLMFLNILPIPLLDGGQLMLLTVEAVTRRPPSEWVVAASQWVGLVLLLGLMVMVTFNDIARIVGS